MMITRHDRSDLRFTTAGGVLALVAISVLFVSLWLPKMKDHFAVAENSRKARATSRLLAHVERGESNELAEQLSVGADPNARSKFTWDEHDVIASALNVAIRNGDPTSVQLLLDAGADPNLAIPHAPLQSALQSDASASTQQRLVNQLLASGADLRASPLARDQMLETNFPDAVAIFELQGIDYGLREMCIAGDLESLKNNLAAPIQDELTHVRDYRGTSTLLGIALLRSHADIADWLLKSGASTAVNEVHNANALTLAALGNCVAMLKPLVLAGCNINAGDVTGDTPLNYAIPQSDPRTIAALLELGATADRLNETTGTYPIHQAAGRFYEAHKTNTGLADAEQIVVDLISSGADMSRVDSHGRTASDLTYEFRARFESVAASGSSN